MCDKNSVGKLKVEKIQIKFFKSKSSLFQNFFGMEDTLQEEKQKLLDECKYLGSCSRTLHFRLKTVQEDLKTLDAAWAKTSDNLQKVEEEIKRKERREKRLINMENDAVFKQHECAACGHLFPIDREWLKLQLREKCLDCDTLSREGLPMYRN